ncbi:hypothetical protein VTI28DRAFT_9164 [Corynascus sepedonium]
MTPMQPRRWDAASPKSLHLPLHLPVPPRGVGSGWLTTLFESEPSSVRFPGDLENGLPITLCGTIAARHRASIERLGPLTYPNSSKDETSHCYGRWYV